MSANGMPDSPISTLSSTPEPRSEPKEALLPAGMSRLPGEKPKQARLTPACFSLLGIAVLTWVALRMGLSAPPVGFLDLVLVVFAAATGGFWCGTFTSIVAAACLDFFFLPPIYHFEVYAPMDWVALGAFEFTALMITLLQQRAQTRAAEATAERQNSERLFYAARGILFLDRDGELGKRITALIQEEFALRGVALFDAPTADVFTAGDCPPDTDQGLRDAYLQNSDIFDPGKQTWFCALRVGVRTVGGLALFGPAMSALMAQAIASLCATTLERARSVEKETRAEAARHTEQLRTAVVEALAHQIKTPLCVIQAANSTLPALGTLSAPQAELVAAIDGQCTKLDDLISHLLGTSELDNAQIEPQLAPVRLSELVKAAIATLEDSAQRKRFSVSAESREVCALADGKLMVVAFTQLVDNAVKYSLPRSPITITIIPGPSEISVRVRSRGEVIAAADRERIFERFYRTAEARQGPVGTGLGLSIAKRIVDAHHGRIGVESGMSAGTIFTIVLPSAAQDGPQTAARTGSSPAA